MTGLSHAQHSQLPPASSRRLDEERSIIFVLLLLNYILGYDLLVSRSLP